MKAPEIVSVGPDVGSTGDWITLGGHFFGTKTAKVYLSFLSNGKPRKKSCSIATWSNEEIVCKVPELPAGTYDVMITNSVGSDTLDGGFIVE